MKAGEGLEDNTACSADPGLLGLENPLQITIPATAASHTVDF